MVTKKSKVRGISIVLPQFHPIPENDMWWGKGFTEWTNVTKAKSLFPGHYQPHLPTDLGFYDLRLPEAREAQANIAKEYGIYGFCYYHYWFNGKRLLNKPIDEILRLKKPDMPFMLCWANENWTRRWDGRNQDVLVKQNYSAVDDENHIRWLCKNIFSDERYITVRGCPVFAIYKFNLFPDVKQTASLWKKIAVEEFGFKGLYLCVMESENVRINPKDINFDAAIEFSPHQVIATKIFPGKLEKLLLSLNLKKPKKYRMADFSLAVENSLERELPDYKLYRSVTPSWDNTARKKNGIIAEGSSPEKFFYWLSNIVSTFQPYSDEENFVFINAMNEWAEGNHLEPCVKYGLAYLEATRDSLK